MSFQHREDSRDVEVAPAFELPVQALHGFDFGLEPGPTNHFQYELAAVRAFEHEAIGFPAATDGHDASGELTLFAQNCDEGRPEARRKEPAR